LSPFTFFGHFLLAFWLFLVVTAYIIRGEKKKRKNACVLEFTVLQLGAGTNRFKNVPPRMLYCAAQYRSSSR
jgi:hypothetical protein